MAASAVKAMRTVPVKEKQVLLETSRHQSKTVLVASQFQKLKFGHDKDVGDRNSKESAALEKTDGAMEGCAGRLALQASSSVDRIEEGVNGDGTVDIDDNAYEALQSRFCLRQYAEIVRQDRGDLKRSWPLAEKFLRGRIFQAWPPIDGPGGVSTVSRAYHRSSFYPSDVPLPHLWELEIAFAESGLSEDREPSWTAKEGIGAEKREGPYVTCSSAFREGRALEMGRKKTKRSKFSGKGLTKGADYVGSSGARGKLKKQDRLLGHIEGSSKHPEHEAVAQTDGHQTISEACERQFHRRVEPTAKQTRRDNTLVHVKGMQISRTEPGVEAETGKKKRLSGFGKDKVTIDNNSNVEPVLETAEDISRRAMRIGKGKTALLSTGLEVEDERPSSSRVLNVHEHANCNSRQGVREAEVTDRFAAERDPNFLVKRRNENDRVLEERSASKSDTPTTSCFSPKGQSNKACPVCHSFSSMSQTTMNVHIDSCLVEHQKAEEHEEAKTDVVESETEPSQQLQPPSPPPPPPPPPCDKPPKVSKGSGAKPKRKKRSITDIVANSMRRVLEEEEEEEEEIIPCKRKDVWLSSRPHTTADDQVQDSKNLNWVSGNKKKRQPRNMSSRNLKEDNENKRRRVSCTESAAEAAKPVKQEKRGLHGKEREGSAKKPKQLRASGPSTNVFKSSKVQDGGEVQSSRGRNTGVAATVLQLPGSKTELESGSAVPSQSKELHKSAREDLPMDLDETHTRSVEVTVSRKSPAPAQENSVPNCTPKAPWYPPAATESPGVSLMAENLTDKLPTTVKSSSHRKSPRTANSVQRWKGPTPAGQGSKLSKDSTDELKVSKITGDLRAGAHIELVSMARCKMSKEVDSDLDQTETAIPHEARLIQRGSCIHGECQAVKSPCETGVTESKSDHLPQKAVVKDVLGKSEGILDADKRPGVRKSRVSEEGTCSVVADEENLTATCSEEKSAKVGRDLSTSSLQDCCDTVALGETDLISGLERSTSTRSTSTLVVSCMKKRGRLKAPKVKRKGKEVLASNGSQGEENSAKGSLSNSDVIQEIPLVQETSLENSQFSEDTLKQEHQGKEPNQQAGMIQSPVKEMGLRERDVIVGQQQVAEQVHVKPVGGEEKVPLLTSDLKNVPVEHEVNKEGKAVPTQVQAILKYTSRLQGGEEIIDLPTSISHRSSSISPHGTVGPLTKEGISQAEGHVDPDNSKVIVNVVQSQSPSWSLVPQRPLGRKKLPIKCATRNIISADAVASATSSLINPTNQESLKDPGTEDPENYSNGSDVLAGDDIAAALKHVMGRSRAARQLAKSVTGCKRSAVHGEVLSSEGQTSVIDDTMADMSRALNPENFQGRNRAARQLAKSVPGCRKGAVRGEVLSSEGQTSITDSALAEPNTENSSNVRSTHAACELQALLSESSRSVEDLSRISTPPERVHAGTSTSKSGASSLIDDGAILRFESVAEVGVSASVERYRSALELHSGETPSACTRNNPEFITHVPTCNGATADKLKAKSPSRLEVLNTAENETDVQGKDSDQLVAPGCQQEESGVFSRRSPDRTVLGQPPQVTYRVNDEESRGSTRRCVREQSLSEIFCPKFVGLQCHGRSLWSSGKVGEATEQSRPNTQGASQAIEPGLPTFTSGPENTSVRFSDATPKVTSTSTVLSHQLARDNQNIYDLVAGSTRVSSFGLNSSTTPEVNFQPSHVQPGLTSTASLPTSFTSLLQSTVLPSQSTAALSLAMQGTRPLQEASADIKELSRAETGASTLADLRSSLDGKLWGLEKHSPSRCKDAFPSSRVPSNPVFFMPRSETGGSCKGSDMGDKEASRLPGWMRAAISDPKGSDRGPLVSAEAEDSLTGKEISGLKVRLWGRDVVVPPNDKSTKRDRLTQQEVSVEPFGAVGSSEAIASRGASTGCLNGATLQSQTGLKDLRCSIFDGVESGRQINAAVRNTSDCETGVTASSGALPALGRTLSDRAENYFSRLGLNSPKSSFTMKSKAEMRRSKSSKAHDSASQSTAPPPEVIIIDDSGDSPAESGDSFSERGLTMSILLDCGALRYLAAGQKGSPLMEVDPSKIPQRLLNSQDFNILAELRRIGLVPAPRTAVPASYRRSHTLSSDVLHSTPSSKSRAGGDILPPWLLAEKKRKEAQNAENVIVLDDDDEGPTETVITSEKGPLNGVISNLSNSSISQQSQPACQVPSSTMVKLARDSVNAKRTSAIPTSGYESPPTSHASPSPQGKETRAGQSNLSRRDHDIISALMSPGVSKEHVNSNTAPDNVVMGESGVQASAARREQRGGICAAQGLSPPCYSKGRDLFLRRTDKEKEVQGCDFQSERTPKAVTGVSKPGPPAAAVCGQDGSASKKGSAPVFSISDPTWNGWTLPKRGAAAQACKQAVERLRAELLSSPKRSGNSLAGSQLIGQTRESTSADGKAHEPLESDSQSSSLLNHLERLSSSPTLRSGTAVGPKGVNEAGTAGLATGSIPPDQRSPFSSIPCSRLSLPLHGESISKASADAFLGQSRQTACFTDRAANERLRDICGLQATTKQATGRIISLSERIQWKEVGLSPSGTSTSGSTTPDLPLSSPMERALWSDGVGLNLPGSGMSRSSSSDFPFSSLFGISSQAANSSNPRSSRGKQIPDHAAANPRDGRMWNLRSQADRSDQASGPVSSSRSRGTGFTPDYSFASLAGGGGNPAGAVSDGFFAAGVGASKPKGPDGSPSSENGNCVVVSPNEEYSHSRSTEEEKTARAQRGSSEFPPTESGEKIRTKSLSSV